MVSAFMDSVHASNGAAHDRPRRSFLERLSVVMLAIRLRTNGSHAGPRGRVWYQAVYGVALMVLLYQAIAATVWTVRQVGFVVDAAAAGEDILAGRDALEFVVWFPVFSLAWVAALFCLLRGRLGAARVLGMLAVAAVIVASVVTHALIGPSPNGVAYAIGDVSRWGWLALSAAAVFVPQQRSRVSRRFWLGAYLLGTLAIVVLGNPEFGLLAQWSRLLDLGTLTSVALVIGMVVVLASAAFGRGPSPQWVLALVVFAVGTGGVGLLRMLGRTPLPVGYESSFPTMVVVLDASTVSLAVLCAFVGLRAMRRLPVSWPSPAGPTR